MKEKPWNLVKLGRGGWRTSVGLAGKQMFWAPSSLWDSVGESVVLTGTGIGTGAVMLVVWFCTLVARVVAGLCGGLSVAKPVVATRKGVV